jgi:hypothetical protein
MLLIRYIFSKIYIVGASFPNAEDYPIRAWFNAYMAAFFYCFPLVVCAFRSAYQYAASIPLDEAAIELFRDFEVGGRRGWLVVFAATVGLELATVGWGARAHQIICAVTVKYQVGVKRIIMPLISSVVVIYLGAICLVSQDPFILFAKISVLYAIAGQGIKIRFLYN